MSDNFEDFIRENWTLEELKERANQHLDSQKFVQHPITCKGCKQTFKYDLEVEDRKTSADMLKWLAERGHGKASPAKVEHTQPVDLSVDVSKLSPKERSDLRRRIEANLNRREPNSG